jgi:hypothetical protein
MSNVFGIKKYSIQFDFVKILIYKAYFRYDFSNIIDLFLQSYIL